MGVVWLKGSRDLSVTSCVNVCTLCGVWEGDQVCMDGVWEGDQVCMGRFTVLPFAQPCWQIF